MAGFLDEYEDIVMDRKRVRMRYLRTWMILDLPASLPYIFFTKFLPERTPLGVFIMCVLRCLLCLHRPACP